MNSKLELLTPANSAVLLSKADQNDRGRAIIDIFRIETCKIVEHWGGHASRSRQDRQRQLNVLATD